MKLDYIQQGDCMQLLKDIPDSSVDLILCDLPYGTTKSNWDIVLPLEDYIWADGKMYSRQQYMLASFQSGWSYKKAQESFESIKEPGLWSLYNRILKPNGTIALFAQEPFASYLRESNKPNYKFDWVWKKPQGSNFLNAKIQPLKNYEVICVFGNGKITYNPQMQQGTPYKTRNSGKGGVYDPYGCYETNNEGERYPLAVLEYSSVNNTQRIHPNQKPVDLLEYLIITHSDKGGVVLDNTMGSGSTIIAAYNTGRHYIGFEKDADIFKTAQENINTATSQIRFEV
jgi:site-specific DNA-methyltransferase (adenine-specific)